MMDEVSVHLDWLQDNGVEVLWRPLHEMNQGVFWWGRPARPPKVPAACGSLPTIT